MKYRWTQTKHNKAQRAQRRRQCTALHCTALHWTALHCTAQHSLGGFVLALEAALLAHQLGVLVLDGQQLHSAARAHVLHFGVGRGRHLPLEAEVLHFAQQAGALGIGVSEKARERERERERES
jgi:adenylylsulfate kinase-like enzyme